MDSAPAGLGSWAGIQFASHDADGKDDVVDDPRCSPEIIAWTSRSCRLWPLALAAVGPTSNRVPLSSSSRLAPIDRIRSLSRPPLPPLLVVVLVLCPSWTNDDDHVAE